jgi:hypothetical protein
MSVRNVSDVERIYRLLAEFDWLFGCHRWRDRPVVGNQAG